MDSCRYFPAGQELVMTQLFRTSVSVFFLFSSLAPVSAYDIPEAEYPELPRSADAAESFVPTGWTIEIMETGDLNSDERDDILLVLKEENPANIITNDPASPGVDEWDANPRILAVAFALPGGGYELVLQNNDFIPRHEDPCIDDPFSLAEMEAGTIQIYLHLWANAGTWYTSDSKFTFRFQDNALRLVSYTNYTTKRNTGETWELDLDYVAGNAVLTTGNYSDDEGGDLSYEKPLPCEELISIEEIGSGWDFYTEQSDISWWEIDDTEPEE